MSGSNNRRDLAFEADVEDALSKLDWDGGDTVVGSSVFDAEPVPKIVEVAPRLPTPVPPQRVSQSVPAQRVSQPAIAAARYDLPPPIIEPPRRASAPQLVEPEPRRSRVFEPLPPPPPPLTRVPAATPHAYDAFESDDDKPNDPLEEVETVLVHQDAFVGMGLDYPAPMPPQQHHNYEPFPLRESLAPTTDHVTRLSRPIPTWVWGVTAGVVLLVAGLGVGWLLFGGDTHSEPAVTTAEPAQPPPKKSAEPPTPPPVKKQPTEPDRKVVTPPEPAPKPPIHDVAPVLVKAPIGGEVTKVLLTTARDVAKGESLFEVVRVTKNVQRAAELTAKIAKLEKIMNQKYEGFVPQAVIEASDQISRARKELAATVSVQRVVIKAEKAGRATPKTSRGAAVNAGAVVAEIIPPSAE